MGDPADFDHRINAFGVTADTVYFTRQGELCHWLCECWFSFHVHKLTLVSIGTVIFRPEHVGPEHVVVLFMNHQRERANMTHRFFLFHVMSP